MDRKEKNDNLKMKTSIRDYFIITYVIYIDVDSC